jgi:hypothetical protein
MGEDGVTRTGGIGIGIAIGIEAEHGNATQLKDSTHKDGANPFQLPEGKYFRAQGFDPDSDSDDDTD